MAENKQLKKAFFLTFGVIVLNENIRSFFQN